MNYWIYIHTYGDNVTYETVYANSELEAKKSGLAELDRRNNHDGIGRKLLDIEEVTTGFSYQAFDAWQRRNR